MPQNRVGDSVLVNQGDNIGIFAFNNRIPQEPISPSNSNLRRGNINANQSENIDQSSNNNYNRNQQSANISENSSRYEISQIQSEKQ